MRRKIKVSASFSGVLPVGQFANSRPGFTAEEEFEFDGENIVVDDVISTRQQELQAICYSNYEAEADRARIEKVKADLKNFRFYPTEKGDQYPSVTSVQNYSKSWNISDEELRQYAAQGNIYDAEVKQFVRTGVFKPSSEILECTADRFIVKHGSLQLSLEPCEIESFLSKFPISDLRVCEKILFNHRYRYAGIPDLEGIYNDLPTLVSIKRTKDPIENAIQEAAYSKCEGMEHIKQALVIELKNESDGGNKQGFSKPSVITDLERPFEVFLYRRAEVKKIYCV